ncbi:MAG: HisS family protein [Chloroflexota bacterium]
MSAQRCKGTKDLSPDEMRKFRLIEGAFCDCCTKWGYEEVQTPTLEYLHLFTSTGTLTPSRLHKVYSFLDWDGWSGERVVLRPDGTIPIARLYIETMSARELAKLFYVTNVFAFEETGTESREKWQCGAELIGAGSARADAELVALALEVVQKLGLPGVELRLSHAGLIRALLGKFGLSPEEQTQIFDRILDGEMGALACLQPERPELVRTLGALLELKGQSAGFLKNMKSLLKKDLPELEGPLTNFIEITSLLEALQIEYQIDLATGRGFEYYTGFMFQLFADGEHVGGGGRYDALIPLLGGRDTPASGFALYLDCLMNLVPGKLTKSSAQKILIRTESNKSQTVKECSQMARFLHDAGYVAELDLGSREPAGFRWTLDIQDKAPRFVLNDRVGRRRFAVRTGDEVLARLMAKKPTKT